MSKVVNLNIYRFRKKSLERQSKILAKVANGSVAYLDMCYIVYNHPELLFKLTKKLHSLELQDNIEKINKSLQTNDYRFKIVGIYNLYNNVNPVLTIINEHDKAKFMLHKKDPRRLWIESLFNDKEWLSLMLNSIKHDISLINKFLNSQENMCIDNIDLLKLAHTRIRLNAAYKTFKSYTK